MVVHILHRDVVWSSLRVLCGARMKEPQDQWTFLGDLSMLVADCPACCLLAMTEPESVHDADRLEMTEPESVHDADR